MYIIKHIHYTQFSIKEIKFSLYTKNVSNKTTACNIMFFYIGTKHIYISIEIRILFVLMIILSNIIA